ncbi:ATP-binding cassette domain-containing protein [Aquamicrobium sp. LC103]|uniref:ABC transporter ATP-binding protein n=1 Tax=Aquamicrobium sp. LC103 TaxID=1120658 RepID=UPI00063ED065|nr:ATP-binding cassette domain-containing protein [Aquamicrobium sp. LC103]TKT78389.1 ATP-binding cassette domain-containing protein [Aquamicrobium sp. LC103]
MLELHRIDAFYGQAHILHDIPLKVAAGERIAVVGRNGAGKSTLLKSIVNAGPIVRGAVSLDGRPLGNMSASDRVRLGVSLVPEDRRIFTHITVAENILLAQYGTERKHGLPTMEEVVERFPMLKDLLGRLGGQLSGGQQQVLAIARSIAAGPRLMLLDEPTEGLAPVIVEDLAEKIIEACDTYGIALVLAEQNLRFARRCTSRMLLLDSGTTVFSGDWTEFGKSTDLVDRYLAV